MVTKQPWSNFSFSQKWGLTKKFGAHVGKWILRGLVFVAIILALGLSVSSGFVIPSTTMAIAVVDGKIYSGLTYCDLLFFIEGNVTTIHTGSCHPIDPLLITNATSGLKVTSTQTTLHILAIAFLGAWIISILFIVEFIGNFLMKSFLLRFMGHFIILIISGGAIACYSLAYFYDAKNYGKVNLQWGANLQWAIVGCIIIVDICLSIRIWVRHLHGIGELWRNLRGSRCGSIRAHHDGSSTSPTDTISDKQFNKLRKQLGDLEKEPGFAELMEEVLGSEEFQLWMTTIPLINISFEIKPDTVDSQNNNAGVPLPNGGVYGGSQEVHQYLVEPYERKGNPWEDSPTDLNDGHNRHDNDSKNPHSPNNSESPDGVEVGSRRSSNSDEGETQGNHEKPHGGHRRSSDSNYSTLDEEGSPPDYATSQREHLQREGHHGGGGGGGWADEDEDEEEDWERQLQEQQLQRQQGGYPSRDDGRGRERDIDEDDDDEDYLRQQEEQLQRERDGYRGDDDNIGLGGRGGGLDVDDDDDDDYRRRQMGMNGNDEDLMGMNGNDEDIMGMNGNDEDLMGMNGNDEDLMGMNGNDVDRDMMGMGRDGDDQDQLDMRDGDNGVPNMDGGRDTDDDLGDMGGQDGMGDDRRDDDDDDVQDDMNRDGMGDDDVQDGMNQDGMGDDEEQQDDMQDGIGDGDPDPDPQDENEQLDGQTDGEEAGVGDGDGDGDGGGGEEEEREESPQDEEQGTATAGEQTESEQVDGDGVGGEETEKEGGEETEGEKEGGEETEGEKGEETEGEKGEETEGEKGEETEGEKGEVTDKEEGEGEEGKPKEGSDEDNITEGEKTENEQEEEEEAPNTAATDQLTASVAEGDDVDKSAKTTDGDQTEQEQHDNEESPIEKLTAVSQAISAKEREVSLIGGTVKTDESGEKTYIVPFKGLGPLFNISIGLKCLDCALNFANGFKNGDTLTMELFGKDDHCIKGLKELLSLKDHMIAEFDFGLSEPITTIKTAIKDDGDNSSTPLQMQTPKDQSKVGEAASYYRGDDFSNKKGNKKSDNDKKGNKKGNKNDKKKPKIPSPTGTAELGFNTVEGITKKGSDDGSGVTIDFLSNAGTAEEAYETAVPNEERSDVSSIPAEHLLDSNHLLPKGVDDDEFMGSDYLPDDPSKHDAGLDMLPISTRRTNVVRNSSPHMPKFGSTRPSGLLINTNIKNNLRTGMRR